MTNHINSSPSPSHSKLHSRSGATMAKHQTATPRPSSLPSSSPPQSLLTSTPPTTATPYQPRSRHSKSSYALRRASVILSPPISPPPSSPPSSPPVSSLSSFSLSSPSSRPVSPLSSSPPASTSSPPTTTPPNHTVPEHNDDEIDDDTALDIKITWRRRGGLYGDHDSGDYDDLTDPDLASSTGERERRNAISGPSTGYLTGDIQ